MHLSMHISKYSKEVVKNRNDLIRCYNFHRTQSLGKSCSDLFAFQKMLNPLKISWFAESTETGPVLSYELCPIFFCSALQRQRIVFVIVD